MFSAPEFWVLVAFVIFVAGVWRPAGKALGALLDDHAAKVKAELEEARRLREEAQRTLADYQRRQVEALAEADAIVAHAKAEAERLRTTGEAELAQQIARRRQLALDRIAQSEAQALAEVRAATVEAAMAATRKLIVENLDRGRADALIDAAAAELPKRLH
ncbi:MAG: F0F1 ATP synthase subunit B [Alphaproteobacteria bacterium]